MKVLWFHLMPYTELPEDFKERHPGVWVEIDPALFDPERAHVMYNDFMDELEFAAEQGFDGICVNEHHSNGYGLMPSPNLIASTLARRTRDAAICVMGSSVALYDPPVRVAEEFAMIDCISGGRLIAGFPVGTPMDTCYAYSQNPSLLRPRYYEAIDLITRAWREEKPFPYNGRFNRMRYVNPWPRPIQKPRPPVWVPGSGSVETWRMCYENDFVYAYLSYWGYKAGLGVMKGFWEEMKAMGAEPNPYHAGFLQAVGVAESHAEAVDLYAGPASYFYDRCLHLDPKFARPPGYISEATVRARLTSQVTMAADQAIAARPFQAHTDNVLEQGHVIVGSPDEVADRLRQVAVDLNVGHLMLLLHFGDMSKDLTRHNTRLFAEKVLPQIADLFDDEWEDLWWPNPMPSQSRAVPEPVAV